MGEFKFKVENLRLESITPPPLPVKSILWKVWFKYFNKLLRSLTIKGSVSAILSDLPSEPIHNSTLQSFVWSSVN